MFVICYKNRQKHWQLLVAGSFTTKAEFCAHLALVHVCFTELCTAALHLLVSGSLHPISPYPTRTSISLIHVVTLFRPWTIFLSYGYVQGLNIFAVKHKHPLPFCLHTLLRSSHRNIWSAPYFEDSLFLFLYFFLRKTQSPWSMLTFLFSCCHWHTETWHVKLY